MTQTKPRYMVRFDDGEHPHDLGATYDKQEAITWLKEKIDEFVKRTGDFADEPPFDPDCDMPADFEILLVDEDDAFIDTFGGWTEQEGFDQDLQNFMNA